MFLAVPKSEPQHKGLVLDLVQCLYLQPEAGFLSPSHLLASSSLEHLPPLFSCLQVT